MSTFMLPASIFIACTDKKTRDEFVTESGLWSDGEGSQEFIKQNIPCDKGLQALITLNGLNGRRS